MHPFPDILDALTITTFIHPVDLRVASVMLRDEQNQQQINRFLDIITVLELAHDGVHEILV